MDKIKNKLCKVCSKKAHLKCEQCGKVSYCSRECQFKDWNRHKNNCKYNTKTKINKDYKRKKTEKNRNIGFDAFNLKGSRKKRHCQTISIKIKNLSELEGYNEQRHYLPKKSIEDVEQIQVNEESNNNNIQEEKKIDFHFVQKFREIIFRKDIIDKSVNGSQGSSNGGLSSEEKNAFNNEYNKERIKKLYELLIEHRNFIIEKILLNSNRTYYFKSINFMIDTYFGIENYILNFILLIKFLFSQKDPLNLVKADQALNILGKELINFHNKNGLLVYSIDCIFRKFVDSVNSKNIYQNIGSIQNITKRFLSLISCIIKLSKVLDDNKMYMKSLSYYCHFFDLSMKFISNVKSTEKIILNSNLKFNIGNIFTKKKYLNSSVKIYKDIINMQKRLDPCSFICGVVYYNISILFYVMDKITESELYLNEGFEKINKILDLKKLNKQREDFRRLIRLLLLFYAELNLDRQNYPKSVQCLKAIIEIMIDDNQNIKIRHKTQGNQDERLSFKFLKHMKFILGNYMKKSSMSPTYKSKLDRDWNNPIKNKIKPMTALEYLYEIQFFSNPSDRVLFDEHLKSMINGLFERISFHYNEIIKKEKEKNFEFIYFRSEKKKRTDKDFFEDSRKKRLDNLMIKEDNLPDLNVRNIVRNNSKTNIDQYSSRDRNKTISKKKITKYLKDRFQKRQEDSDTNILKIGNEIKFLTKETTNKIISYLNDKMVKKKKIIDNEKDISDFKYFFLLLTSLSFRQVEILNNTQSVNMPKALYKNLPILFSKQFKNSLNPSQRNMFNKLRVLSLIRCKVLKDANKPISVDNINYNIFHSQINFDDFKLKQYSHIQEIIREVIQSKEEKNNHEVNIYKRLINYNSAKRNSNRNSFTERKEENLHDKPIFKNYIEQKKLHKKLQFDNDSNDNSEEESSDFLLVHKDVEFKYKNEYDIQKLRILLIQKINKGHNYTEDEKELYKQIVYSGIFIQLMNCLELSEIIEFEKDLGTIIELLKCLEELRLKENEDSFLFNLNEKNQIKNISNSSSSSNSLEIDIEEKNILNNDIRRTFIMQKPKFQLDINSIDLSESQLSNINEENNTINNNNTMGNNKKFLKKYIKSKTFFNNDNVEKDLDMFKYKINNINKIDEMKDD